MFLGIIGRDYYSLEISVKEVRLYKTIKVIEKKKDVVEFCLSRPEVANAYNHKMIDELLVALAELSSSVRVLVISGDGKNFQAGADLEWLRKASDQDVEHNMSLSLRSFKFFDSLQNLSIPVIAKIRGFCGGGGTGIVAACDMAIASNDAIFSIGEVRWGMTATIIFPALHSSISPRNIARYALTGDQFDARRAQEIGLISDISQPELLDEGTAKIIDSILQCSHSAIVSTKQELLNCTDWDKVKHSLISAHAKQRMSFDAKKGMDAFIKKSKPDWY